MSSVIGLDDNRFYRLVTLSNKYASRVLRKVIAQYCTENGLPFQDVLELYKHELFHYWCGATAPCCKCNSRKFKRVLLDKQWYTLFTDISTNLSATHPHAGHNIKGCPEVFGTRAGIDVDVCDVSLASSLLTNITGKITNHSVVGLITNTRLTVTGSINMHGLLEYTIDKLSSKFGVGGFEKFLNLHQHELFHCMEQQRCCKCTSDTDGKTFITQGEWEMMYASTPTTCNSPTCSHKYSPIRGIVPNALKIQLLQKICQAVGPVTTVRKIRNQIAHAATSTMDDSSFKSTYGVLAGSLNELIDIISNSTWRNDMKCQIANLQTCPINAEMFEEYRRDLHKYLEVRGFKYSSLLVEDKSSLLLIYFCPSFHNTPTVSLPDRS